MEKKTVKFSRGKQMVASVLKLHPEKHNLKDSDKDNGGVEYTELRNLLEPAQIQEENSDIYNEGLEYTELRNVQAHAHNEVEYSDIHNEGVEYTELRNVQAPAHNEVENSDIDNGGVDYTELRNVQAPAHNEVENSDIDNGGVDYTELRNVQAPAHNEVENSNIDNGGVDYTELRNVQAPAHNEVENSDIDNGGVDYTELRNVQAPAHNEVENMDIDNGGVDYTELRNVQAPAHNEVENSDIDNGSVDYTELRNVQAPAYIEVENSENSDDVNRETGSNYVVSETSISEISDSDQSCDQFAYQNLQSLLRRNEDFIARTAEASSPKLNESTRKRKRNPKRWKRTVQKDLRMKGKEYTTRSGNRVRPRQVKDVNCKCHYKCNTKISAAQRQQILNEYLTLENEHAKWAFIGKSVTTTPVKRRYQENSNKRSHTKVYTLTCEGQKMQVCQKFFIATLDISVKKVNTSIKKLTDSGITEPDKRGKKEPPNKKTEQAKNTIRNHIKSLPVVSSHYCRSTTKRKYLPSGLSEKRLYLDYVEYCKEQHIVPEKASYYIEIFTTEFNYGFHRPKKDQCDYCTQYKNKTEEEKNLKKEEFELHQKRKIEARDHKIIDKALAKENPAFHCYAMDLEKILLTPSLQIGQLYFKKKLKTYNFTVYNLGSTEATNYMWHEAAGTKGSSEIATCLWKLITSVSSNAKEITFYSDTASGQNRNSIVSAMFLRGVTMLPIETINQKFMESGHSEMECDTVHSTIETRGRKIDVFTPEGWYTIARTAKTEKPYHKVVELEHSDFLDFKSYCSKVMSNKTKSDCGEKMNWLLVKWFQYRKSDPGTIFYKTNLSDGNFKSLTIQRRRRKQDTLVIQNLYYGKLKIEHEKITDLLNLCQKGSIPSTYHAFYNNLVPGAGEESSDE